MQIVVKGKNFNITDALKEYTELGIRKMTKHFDGIISADVTLSTERNWHVVEVTVYASGFVIRGEDRTNDMYASIDNVLDKLGKQLRKQKGKWEKKMRAHKAGDEDLFNVSSPRGPEGDYDEEDLILTNPMVVRIPMVTQKPMTEEEAIKEMEALDFSFFVFVNSRTDVLNVLYRRKGGYGLVDPTMERAEV